MIESIPQRVYRILTPIIVFGLGMVLSWLLAAHRYQVPPEGDLGCFMAVAQHMHEGNWLYTDVWDNKAPGIFFVHYVAQCFSDSVTYTTGITVFFILLFFGSLAYVFRNERRDLILSLSVIIAFLLLRWFLFWEVAFVGGFTEEIGMLCLGIALIWFYQKEGVWFYISALFMGLALFIKEPFALFLPAFWLNGWYRSIWLPKKWIKWNLIAAAPWLIFVFIYAVTDRLDALFAYVQGAFLYTDEGHLSWSVFLERWLNIEQFANSLLIEYASLFKWLIRIGGVRLMWLLYRRLRYKEQYKIGAYYIFLAWSLLAAAVFLSLGSHAYLHYGMPYIAVFTLAFVLLFYDLVHAIKGPLWEPLYPVVYVLGIWSFISSHKSHSGITQTLHTGSAIMEQQKIRKKIEPKASVFVAWEQIGRYYFYLNSVSKSRYPVPYYTYFYNETNNHRDDLIQHRQRFQEDFLKNPPDYVLTYPFKYNAPVFNFTQLQTFVQDQYSIVDSVPSVGEYVYVLRKK